MELPVSCDFYDKGQPSNHYGKLRRKIGGIIRDLFPQKGLYFHAGHAMKDQGHICLSIPPKFSVSNTDLDL
jgi:putative transposase